MVVYLVPDRFAADDTVLAADRFDAVEVRDPGVAVSAFAYLVGDPFGEQVEVWVGFEEAGHVAAGSFALEVVVDRPADECGVSQRVCLQWVFRAFPIWTMPAADGAGWVRVYWPGARFDFRLGRGLPSHWLAWRVVVA